MFKPTAGNILLEMREKVLAGGLILEGKEGSSMTNEFFIIDIGWEVPKEFKKGQQVHLSIPQIPVREIEGKKYAIVNFNDIIATE